MTKATQAKAAAPAGVAAELIGFLKTASQLEAAHALTLQLWQKKDFESLIRVYAKLDIFRKPYGAHDNETVGKVLQQEIILGLPAELWVDVYVHATRLEDRRALTVLIWNTDLVRKLIKRAWKERDLAEVAIHFGQFYREINRDDWLTGQREYDTNCYPCLDGYPKAMLKALSRFAWDLDYYAGIDRWLNDELNPR